MFLLLAQVLLVERVGSLMLIFLHLFGWAQEYRLQSYISRYILINQVFSSSPYIRKNQKT
jgi:hypothetical protein